MSKRVDELRIRTVRRLRQRLLAESEPDLARQLEFCGSKVMLTCLSCGKHHEGTDRCKKRWCPRCCVGLAARRNEKMKPIVERFQWPLFITLTMKNTEDLSMRGIKHLRRAFGKLRHRRFWKENVRGGLATIEVTNIGNGWHPHLHAVIDCEWLAITTRKPQRGSGKQVWKERCQEAAAELERNWAKCLGQETASVKVKRCSGSSILKEVIKYAIKGSDLLECKEKIGPLIRAMEGTRLMTTFGTVYKPMEVSTDEIEDGKPKFFNCCIYPEIRPTMGMGSKAEAQVRAVRARRGDSYVCVKNRPSSKAEKSGSAEGHSPRQAACHGECSLRG
jgi:hypothetical protein